MTVIGGPRSRLPQAPPNSPFLPKWSNKSSDSFVRTAAISAIKKEAQMLDEIPWYPKAIYGTFGFVALTHLLLMEASCKGRSFSWSKPTVSSSACLSS